MQLSSTWVMIRSCLVRRGPFLLLTLFWILIAWAMAAVAWNIWELKHPKQSRASKPVRLLLTSEIVEGHIFGNYIGGDVDLPQARIPYVLQGVVSQPQNSRSAHGLVMLADTSGRVNIYHVGDVVHGATILRILDNHVVLRVDGGEQVLRLPVPKL